MDLPSNVERLAPEILALYGLRHGTTRLGLGSTRRLLRLLGHPERNVPMLHVAGTNGKGSTTALAAAMLQAGGLRVGRYTSPHVLQVEERICVDGAPIEPDTLRRHIRDLWPWFERTGVSFFEAMTVMAALHFRDAGAEVAVYEVGLGGRLDATNAIASATSILTSIGHDHEAILGRGLRAVCREKLGIVRRGVPLFAALDRADLVQMARAHAAARRAPFTLVPADAGQVVGVDLELGTRIVLRMPRPLELTTRLLGAHQGRNVALAACGVLSLRRCGAIGREPDVTSGAARAFLPGRFQVLAPAPGEPLVVLDVGHNPEALQTTLDAMDAVLPQARPVVVLGLLADKRLGGAALRLARSAREIVLTAPAVERAWDPAAARALFPRGRGLARVHAVPHVADALAAAHECGGPLLVLGSHYLLGEAVPVLAARRNVAPEQLLYGVGDEPLRAAV